MMTPLWLGMAVLAAVALAFVLWPLVSIRQAPQAGAAQVGDRQAALEAQLAQNVALFREHLAELSASRERGDIGEDEFTQLRLELERGLLEDERQLRAAGTRWHLGFGPRSLVVVALVFVVGSIGIYNHLGASQDVHLTQLQLLKWELDQADMLAQREPDKARAQELLEGLQARLARNPENLQQWFFLARTAMEVSDFDLAVSAYREVLSRDPQSPRVAAELAQAMFLRDDNRMSPAIAELAQTALALDPRNTTALGLAGIDAFERRAYQEAIQHWEGALALLDPNSMGARSLQVSINRARTQLAEGVAESDVAESDRVADAGMSVRFQVALAEQVQVPPETLVYIYARAWQGSPMPLAIIRKQVADLPATIILDDTMAMSTMATLSQADQVELVARISLSGDAVPGPGDWQGSVGPIKLSNQPDAIELKIDRQLP